MSDKDLFSESESNDSDIIECTPDASTRKRKRNSSKNVFVSVQEEPEIEIPKTPPPPNAKIQEIDYETEQVLPFIFYEVREMAKFNTKHYPANNKFMSVGFFVRNNECLSLLTEKWKKEDNMQINLDFKALNNSPNNGTYIQVFGNMVLEDDIECPTLLVKMWKYLIVNEEKDRMGELVNLLLYQRQHTSPSYLEIITKKRE